jgi:cytochrome P450
MTQTLILDESFTRDPHATLHQLQAESPVSRAVMWGGVPVWLVTGYDEAKALLADPRLSKDHAHALRLFPPNSSEVYEDELNSHMLNTDPPGHTRLRKLVVKAFTARAVEGMRPQIESIADELLDAIDTGGPVDLIAAYAGPLPVRVISELLGIPADRRSRFQAQLEPLNNESDREAKTIAFRELTSMLTNVVAEKRREPTGDLISALIEATEEGDRLSESELLAMIFLLIAAGYDTTVNLIANGVLALLRNPRQLWALRACPSLMPNAVEEFLRFDSPVNIASMRFTTVPIRVGEVEIPKNQFLMISLLAANHDADNFEDPGQLDITRKPNAHLAFGHGIHHCVGAGLGRLEGRIALERLLARFERLELATTSPIEYRNSTQMHGLSTLPVWCARPPN